MWEDTGQLMCVASKLGPPCGEEDITVWLQIVSTKARLVSGGRHYYTYFNVRLFKDCEMIPVLYCVEGWLHVQCSFAQK